MIFNLHLGVGHSVLCQMEGVDHMSSNYHIFKCPTSTSPPFSTLFVLPSPYLNPHMEPSQKKNQGYTGGKYVLLEGDMGICGVAVLIFFYSGDAVSRISICGVAVISNPSVCDFCVFHVAVFGEMKLFAVFRGLSCGDAVFVNFFAVLRCCGVQGPPHAPLLLPLCHPCSCTVFR